MQDDRESKGISRCAFFLRSVDHILCSREVQFPSLEDIELTHASGFAVLNRLESQKESKLVIRPHA